MRRLLPTYKSAGEGSFPERDPEPLVVCGVAETTARTARAAEVLDVEVPCGCARRKKKSGLYQATRGLEVAASR